ncbi:hypothetical protein FE257_008599 [Aspergillus nanangensis]|uniref:Jacalin-type lectin domain-containing protein n=1 Tax=Aspergillus nanangensis TaxID=2582783 RepID=A0AAD4GTA3_ASPNN|nr:hypothetical protein FE257_008599 [Aspergillus nanangensis]
MDGAVVHYADGQHANCGPPPPHEFGGHASEKHTLPPDAVITKVRLCKEDSGWGSLAGIRMTLSNGDEWGYLNCNNDDEEANESVVTLEPADDEVIVGFYGQSEPHSGFTLEFGILTAQKGEELPQKSSSMRRTPFGLLEYIRSIWR